ncbi:MAG TPA: NAD(P)H-binding protein [Myxococcota bacterium]|nr:NAD(P)H-binding protein [Myxococcota bacterium]
MPHLVLGATGAFGGAVLRELRRRGESVRVLLRNPEKLPPMEGVEVIQGNAMHRGAVIDAAKDCESIFQGLNTPFSNWRPELVLLHESAIEAAGLSGATLVLPGTFFPARPIFDVPLPPQTWEPMPLDFVSELGKIRQDMEAELIQNSELREVRSIVLRSGDFFGPGVVNPIVGPMFQAALEGKAVPWLLNPDIAHLFHYVDDVAALAVELLGVKGRPAFEVVNVPGHLLNGHEWSKSLGEAVGKGKLGVQGLGSLRLWLEALFSAEGRHRAAALPVWKGSYQVDDRPTRQMLPSLRQTPLEEALRATVDWYRSRKPA